MNTLESLRKLVSDLQEDVSYFTDAMDDYSMHERDRCFSISDKFDTLVNKINELENENNKNLE
jgi:hypothetical protein